MMDRRKFVQLLGSGLVVAAAAPLEPVRRFWQVHPNTPTCGLTAQTFTIQSGVIHYTGPMYLTIDGREWRILEEGSQITYDDFRQLTIDGIPVPDVVGTIAV